MTDTLSTEPRTPPTSVARRLLGEVSRLEWALAATAAVVMLALVLAEPDILDAPFQNWRTLVFTVGGTAIAAVLLMLMLWFRVPPFVRIVVLGVPFVAVSWWLISPYFVDDVVNEEFETSIAESQGIGDATAPPGAGEAESGVPSPTSAPAPAGVAPDDAEPEPSEPASEPTEPEPTAAAAPEPPNDPVLLGAGSFVGLAGHSGSGDAGVFRQPDGSLVVRLENFDIQNGPDLKLYVVPGPDMTSLADGSINLGDLRGNVGNQTYELPPGTDLTPGAYTVLVWCEAFSVEFVGATVTIA